MSEDIGQQLERLNQQVIQLYQQGWYEQALVVATRVCNLARWHSFYQG